MVGGSIRTRSPNLAIREKYWRQQCRRQHSDIWVSVSIVRASLRYNFSPTDFPCENRYK